MNNRFSIESGKGYSLGKLFSGKLRIIIPDLQRDYCWGDKAWDVNSKQYNELVSGFVKNLLISYGKEKNDAITLGLIYGYEQPLGHIQLCDGQQRITTLFLLLGVLNIRSNHQFNDFIISKEEQDDDFEPNLQYAIRESTLYFLSDICRFVFLGNYPVSQIKKASWYFQEYEQDASIQSMICAINTICCVLDDLPELNSALFANYILDNIYLLYYDMETRQRGEETYVVINTTGEPLSSTENLKPVLLGNLRGDDLKLFSDEWEYREDWFWFRRGEDKTSDAGLNTFFIWYWQIGLLQEHTWTNDIKSNHDPKDLFVNKPKLNHLNYEDTPDTVRWDKFNKLEQVHKTFKSLERLVSFIASSDDAQNVLQSINPKDSFPKDESGILFWFRNSDLNIILPLIAYSEKFPDGRLLCRFIRRLRKNWFNVARKDSWRKNGILDWRHLVQIVEFATSEEDVLCYDTKSNSAKFKNIPNIPLNEWYDLDEVNKAKLVKDGYLEKIMEWEDHPDFMGDLSVIWMANGSNSVSYENIQLIWKRYERLDNSLNEKKAHKDVILSNFYRLYRVLSGVIKIEHQSYMSWSHRGCMFSEPTYTYNWMLDKEFIEILSSDDVQDAIIEAVKGYIQSLDNNNDRNDYKTLLKYWLVSHVLYANEQTTLLSFYNEYAISIYTKIEDNMLNPEAQDYFLGNIICGYGNKYGVWYASGEYWNNPSCLDTLIMDHISKEEFESRQTIPIPIEVIKAIDEKIHRLIDNFVKK